MTPAAYVAAIEHAVMSEHAEVVRSIALRLAETEQAMEMLLNSGIGTSGMGIAALVRLALQAN